MAIKLEAENVRIILGKMIYELELWSAEEKEAEKTLCYIAGMTDMANAVIKEIEKLGGK